MCGWQGGVYVSQSHHLYEAGFSQLAIAMTQHLRVLYLESMARFILQTWLEVAVALTKQLGHSHYIDTLSCCCQAVHLYHALLNSIRDSMTGGATAV